MPFIDAGRSCLAFSFTCALMSGCVARPVYDETWAEQVKVESGACPIIDGEYRNAGKPGMKEKHKAKCQECEHITRSLAHILNGGYGYEWHEAQDRLGHTTSDAATDEHQSIRLQLAEDKLHVEALLADGSTMTFDLPTRQRCRNSTVLLEVSWDGTDIMGSVPFFSVVNRASLALGRAEDGSLLVRSTSTNGMFLLEWPLFLAAWGDWTRFPQVEPAPAVPTG